MNKINIQECDFQTITTIHNLIPEFGGDAKPEDFIDRCVNKHTIVLSAAINGHQAGYVIAYNRYDDGSIYCWMAGVVPAYRSHGVHSALMNALSDLAKKNGYNAITIKTRNNRREMLSWLVKNQFQFMHVDTQPDTTDNRIHLRKTI